MPIDPSVYQYCEAQDIPIQYLHGYEEQPEPGGFEWKNLFLITFLLLLALPLVVLIASVYAVVKLTF